MKILGFDITRHKPVNLSTLPVQTQQGSFNITLRQVPIVPATVDEFKTAYNLATGRHIQSRITLYDQYQNALELDAHLRGLIEHRLLATVGRKLNYVMADGSINEDVEQMLDAPVWESFIRDVLMCRFWGQGLFEFDKDTVRGRDWFTYWLINRKHIDPYNKVVTTEQFGTSGTSYEGRDNAMYIGSPDDLGLLLPLTLLSIYRRANESDWAQYASRAATNFEIVQFAGQVDPLKQQQALSRISQRGAGAVGVPEGVTDIKVESQTSSQQNQLFENRTKYIDEQQTKMVLGQTMTTSDGSSRSQAEVHERTQETIFDGDAKYLLNVLNYQFYDIQQMFGVPEGGRWMYADNNSAKQLQELERDIKLKELGYVFTSEQIAEKYDIL